MIDPTKPDAPAPLTNNVQIQTTLSTLVGVAAGYAAGHYQGLGLSVGDWTIILTGLVSIGAVIWPALITKGSALKSTVGSMKNTIVVTDKASADAIPNIDVVAATPKVIAAIKEAQQ